MAFSKHQLYLPDDQLLCSFNRAFSYPARLEILRQLFRDGPSCVQVLHNNHPISKETFSDHLKILRREYLVECKERFPFTFYELNLDNVRLAGEKNKEFFQYFN